MAVDPVHLAAAALAAGENPRAVLDRFRAGQDTGPAPAPLSEAHLLAGRIAVALHAGDAQADDPLELLPLLVKEALTPVTETQTSRALAQLIATLGVYYRDAETLRAGLPPPPRAPRHWRQVLRRLLGR